MRKPALLLALVGAIGAWAAMPATPAMPATEYQVKAAFLLNFTKFIEWPDEAFADATAPFAICILGDDPFGNLIDQMVEGETVKRRKLMVRRLRKAPPPKACQILFVTDPERGPPIPTGLGPGVLTVGEGGVIRFVVENRRVRFDVNQSAAAASGLTISSKLLSVARSVQR